MQAAPASPNVTDEVQHKAVCKAKNVEGPKDVCATASEQSPVLSSEVLQQMFLQTGVIDAVLQAVEVSAAMRVSGNTMTQCQMSVVRLVSSMMLLKAWHVSWCRAGHTAG